MLYLGLGLLCTFIGVLFVFIGGYNNRKKNPVIMTYGVIITLVGFTVMVMSPTLAKSTQSTTTTETTIEPDFKVTDLGWRESIGSKPEYNPATGLWYYKIANNPDLPTDNPFNQRIVWVNLLPGTSIVDGGFVRNIKDGKEYVWVVEVEKLHAPSYLGLVTWFVRANNKPPQ